MILAIDIGNSRLKWRVSNNERVVARGSAPIQRRPLLGGFPYWAALTDIHVASVVGTEVNELLVQTCGAYTAVPVRFAGTVPVCGGVTCAYDDVAALGVDRWLAMMAAFQKGQAACCVIDCGSALTVDYISSDGIHQGGYIMPGPELMSRVLNRDTEAVTVSLTGSDFSGPGRSTQECAERGVWLMVQSAVDRIIQEALRSGYQKIFLTGGLGARLEPASGNVLFLPDLVLDGLEFALAPKMFPC